MSRAPKKANKNRAARRTDFECLLRKVQDCERSKQESFSDKTGLHEACGFSQVIVRSDGKAANPVRYRGEDAVYVFLSWILHEEGVLRVLMAEKTPVKMTPTVNFPSKYLACH